VAGVNGFIPQISARENEGEEGQSAGNFLVASALRLAVTLSCPGKNGRGLGWERKECPSWGQHHEDLRQKQPEPDGLSDACPHD
jgi:hypothetical protein